MKILLAQQALDEIQNYEPNEFSLKNIISLLEKLDPKNPDLDKRIRRVSGAETDIYVLRDRGARIFFTKKENDLVILSVETG